MTGKVHCWYDAKGEACARGLPVPCPGMTGGQVRGPRTADEISHREAPRRAGDNGPVSTAMASSFLNAAGTMGRVTISERIEAARRERRVLTRVCRAAWRLEQAERERTWALVSGSGDYRAGN